MNLDERLIALELERQPYPLVFATVSGAHLYGFPSPDSDYDIRGVHVLPAAEVVGLKTGPETVSTTGMREGVEMDVVTQEAKKFMQLMLKRNGYVLEQLYSPLVMHTTPEHGELKELGKACITRHHSHHYLGFAVNQWELFRKEDPPRVKPLLYVFRVLLTGIHLMRTGAVEANVLILNREFKLAYIDELVALKLAGPEKGKIADGRMEFYESEYMRLLGALEDAGAASSLPNESTAGAGLHDLLVRIRLRTAR